MTNDEIHRKRFLKTIHLWQKVSDLASQKRFREALMLNSIILDMEIRKAQIILKYRLAKFPIPSFPEGGVPITGKEEIVLRGGMRGGKTIDAPELKIGKPYRWPKFEKEPDTIIISPDDKSELIKYMREIRDSVDRALPDNS